MWLIMVLLFSIYWHNGGVERSPRNAGALKARWNEADFRSNDLLATRESARGAVSHLLSLYFCEKQVGRADPQGRSTPPLAPRAARR
jgi:hypothetical protein